MREGSCPQASHLTERFTAVGAQHSQQGQQRAYTAVSMVREGSSRVAQQADGGDPVARAAEAVLQLGSAAKCVLAFGVHVGQHCCCSSRACTESRDITLQQAQSRAEHKRKHQMLGQQCSMHTEQ